MLTNKTTKAQRDAMHNDLKKSLKDLLAEGRELKDTREGIAQTSKFNFFKRQRMKFHISSGIANLKKSIYDFEKKYSVYHECLSLNQQSVLIPYVKLLFSIITLILNILLVVDM
jgi:hypothetical protein